MRWQFIISEFAWRWWSACLKLVVFRIANRHFHQWAASICCSATLFYCWGAPALLTRLPTATAIDAILTHSPKAAPSFLPIWLRISRVLPLRCCRGCDSWINRGGERKFPLLPCAVRAWAHPSHLVTLQARFWPACTLLQLQRVLVWGVQWCGCYLWCVCLRDCPLSFWVLQLSFIGLVIWLCFYWLLLPFAWCLCSCGQ